MCGKIQHTTTFVSVLLVYPIYRVWFLSCDAWSQITMDVRDNIRHALYGFFRLGFSSIYTIGWNFFSLKIRLFNYHSWILKFVISHNRPIESTDFANVIIYVRIAWKLAFYIEIDCWTFLGWRFRDILYPYTRLYE